MISTPRRTFLQTAVLAIPSATLAVPFLDEPVVAQESRRRKNDPVLQEILRQAKAATNAATKPGVAPSGESMRQLANALRMLAAHGSAIGLDAAINKGLRSLGREAVLAHRPDINAIVAKLRAEGIDADASRLAQTPDDPAARAVALDSILKNGASASFIAIAHSIEETGAKLDKQRGAIQLVKQDHCGSMWWDLFMLEVAMFAACGPWALAIWEACVVAAAAYFTMKANACYVWGCC